MSVFAVIARKKTLLDPVSVKKRMVKPTGLDVIYLFPNMYKTVSSISRKGSSRLNSQVVLHIVLIHSILSWICW